MQERVTQLVTRGQPGVGVREAHGIFPAVLDFAVLTKRPRTNPAREESLAHAVALRKRYLTATP